MTSEAQHPSHPSPAQYWVIAAILAVITGAEVAIPYLDVFEGKPRVLALIVLGSVKFAAVVAFFMHLRFDKPLYRNLFLVGLFGAIAMFMVVLLTFTAL
jgi:cytochrome c oxidase subunit IV